MYLLYPSCRALGVSRRLLVRLSNVLLASFFLFIDMGLPSMDGTYKLVHYIYTKVSKSFVCMTNNYSRVKRWWTPSIVDATISGAAIVYVFCHRTSRALSGSSTPVPRVISYGSKHCIRPVPSSSK
jgi:hypothetical protein